MFAQKGSNARLPVVSVSSLKAHENELNISVGMIWNRKKRNTSEDFLPSFPGIFPKE